MDELCGQSSKFQRRCNTMFASRIGACGSSAMPPAISTPKPPEPVIRRTGKLAFGDGPIHTLAKVNDSVCR